MVISFLTVARMSDLPQSVFRCLAGMSKSESGLRLQERNYLGDDTLQIDEHHKNHDEGGEVV